MGNEQQRNVDIAVAGLKEISQEFASEMQRKSSGEELFEVLTWALKSMSNDTLSDVNTTDIIALRPEIKTEAAQSFNRGTQTHDAHSAVADLNDATFVAATDLFRELVEAIKEETGQPPTLNHLLDVLLEGLHRSGNLLLDINPTNITRITPELRP